MLLDNDADPNACIYTGETAFEEMCEHNMKEEILMMMIEKINFELRDSNKKEYKSFEVKRYNNERALIHLCKKEKLNFKCIQILAGKMKSFGLDCLFNNRTSLYCLCENNSVSLDFVKVLIENNASPNSINVYGRTPLHVAAGAYHSFYIF